VQRLDCDLPEEEDRGTLTSSQDHQKPCGGQCKIEHGPVRLNLCLGLAASWRSWEIPWADGAARTGFAGSRKVAARRRDTIREGSARTYARLASADDRVPEGSAGSHARSERLGMARQRRPCTLPARHAQNLIMHVPSRPKAQRARTLIRDATVDACGHGEKEGKVIAIRAFYQKTRADGSFPHKDQGRHDDVPLPSCRPSSPSRGPEQSHADCERREHIREI
jgi:hypothetical protein